MNARPAITDTGHEGIGSSRDTVRAYEPAVGCWLPICDVMKDALVKHGLRVARYGEKPTHAVCQHGRVALIAADDHACRWLSAVAVSEGRPQ